MINSQRRPLVGLELNSISKGMGDQFSAGSCEPSARRQYIKGDG